MKEGFAARIRLVAVCALASVSVPALAQSASPDAAVPDKATAPDETAGPVEAAAQNEASGEIVVTARRRAENIQDVPVAVTAFSGETLSALGVERVADLRNVTAGLNIQGGAGREDNPIYLIRGQRTTDTFAFSDGAVASYVDEVLIGANVGSNLGLFDLESVQVLKGPQGTLFGRNTTGGAILFSTAKPKKDFEAGITVGYGNYDQRLIEAFVNLPGSDVIKARAAMQYNKRDGFSRIVEGPRTGDRLQNRDDLSGRFLIQIDPTDTLSSLISVYAARSDSNGPGSFLLGVNPISVSAFIPGAVEAAARQQGRSIFQTGIAEPTFSRTRVWGAYNVTSFELSDNVTFRNLIGYRHLNYSGADDFDASPARILYTVRSERTREFSEEFQIQGTNDDDSLNYVFGIYYFDLDGSSGGDIFALPDINPFGPVFGGGSLGKESFSGYGQFTWKTPMEGLSLTAGLRYTKEKRTTTLTQQILPSAPVGAACSIAPPPGVVYTLDNCFRSGEANFSSPTWTLSADYKPDPDTLVYLAHRRGFRSGGFSGFVTSDPAFTPFRPEDVYDVELGLKKTFRFGEWRVRTNLAGYYQWYKNIQRSISFLSSDNVFVNSIINAGSARIYGGEAEVNIEPNRNLSLGLNYSYVRARYKDFDTLGSVNVNPFVPGSGTPTVIDLTDRDFAFVPAHQFSANLSYEYPFNDGSALRLTGNFFYQSSQKFAEQYQNVGQLRSIYLPAFAALIPDDLPGFGQSGYGLLGLRLDWSNIGGSGVTASVIGKNVTNKRYFSSGTVGYESLGTAALTPGDPRTVLGQISIKF